MNVELLGCLQSQKHNLKRCLSYIFNLYLSPFIPLQPIHTLFTQ